MSDPPEPPDLLREAARYDPARYVALRPAPPEIGSPRPRGRLRSAVILAVVAAIPAALFALVAARMQHVDPASSGALAMFLGAWLLIVLFGAGRWVLMRDR